MLEVANTIAQQLGHSTGRMVAMIGACNFVGSEDSLSFRFKARARNGANACRVTLTPYSGRSSPHKATSTSSVKTATPTALPRGTPTAFTGSRAASRRSSALAQFKEDDVGTIWEYYNKAGARSINGYPCFFSLHVMCKKDWEKAIKAIRRELERRREAAEEVLADLG